MFAVGAGAAELRPPNNLLMLRMAGQGQAGRSEDEVQIELAVGDVSRMRVAVRFEIGRAKLCWAVSLLPFRAVACGGLVRLV